MFSHFPVSREQRFAVNGTWNGERHRWAVRTYVAGDGQSSFGYTRRSGGMRRVSSRREGQQRGKKI